MPYRIAIGEVAHETNTFCAAPTEVGAFRRYQWERGEAIIAGHAGNRSYVGGMLDAADRLGVTAVPVFCTTATPSGTITAAAYATILDELLGGLTRAQPLDAVCLSLHGAGVAEGVDDLEGDLLRRVRELVGPEVPIAVALDLHGNLTAAMVEYADGLFGTNFYPHTDCFERGGEAVEFLVRLLRREIDPAMHLTTLPMMIPTCSTDLEPGNRLNSLCWEWEKRPGLLDATIFHGFGYTDVPPVGMSVLTIADGDAALAREAGAAIARAIWAAREEYRPTSLTPQEAIAAALAVADGPVVLNDTSDNPGGGSPGDGTHLLRAILDAGLTGACFAFVTDPQTAALAHDAGIGATIRVRLGGKTDDLHGAPIEAEAYVKALTDGRFRQTTPMRRGLAVDLGPSARIVIDGVDIIVASERGQVFDDEVLLLHGIDVRRRRIVALKSSAHFRAGFTDLAAAIVTADAPGATTLHLDHFDHRRIRRPIWPLDADVTFEV